MGNPTNWKRIALAGAVGILIPSVGMVFGVYLDSWIFWVVIAPLCLVGGFVVTDICDKIGIQ
jgi:hypothetical protein